MKLGKLNAAIDAAPVVLVRFAWGHVALQKGSLKAMLRDHFNGERAAETGLKLAPNGALDNDRPGEATP